MAHYLGAARLAFLMSVAFSAQHVTACTPAASLMYFMPGPTAFGAIVTRSIFALFAAVVIKCVAYSRLADRSLGGGSFDMVVANVVSTVPAILIIVLVASGPSIFLGLAIGGLSVCIVAARIFNNTHIVNKPRWAAFALSFGLCVALIASVISFHVMESIDVSDIVSSKTSALRYWGAKLLMSFTGIVSTLAIGVVFEAATISWIRRKEATFDSKKSLDAVLKANLLVLFIGAIAGAVMTLPQRLQSEGFLLLGN